MFRLWAAAVIALAWSAAAAPGPPPIPARVLFIGNSLTYANDLPAMVASLSRGTISTGMVAFPDYSLEDHWRRGDAVRAIRKGGWTHVVLQQGPSSLPESRRLLVRDATRFAREIRKTGADVVLYGVWPPSERRGAFRAVTDSYAEAATATNGALVAVGQGWQAVWSVDEALPLYGPDGFHPSPLGTYVAALMLVAHVTGSMPAAPDAAAYGVTRERLRGVHDAVARAREGSQRIARNVARIEPRAVSSGGVRLEAIDSAACAARSTSVRFCTSMYPAGSMAGAFAHTAARR